METSFKEVDNTIFGGKSLFSEIYEQKDNIDLTILKPIADKKDAVEDFDYKKLESNYNNGDSISEKNDFNLDVITNKYNIIAEQEKDNENSFIKSILDKIFG